MKAPTNHTLLMSQATRREVRETEAAIVKNLKALKRMVGTIAKDCDVDLNQPLTSQTSRTSLEYRLHSLIQRAGHAVNSVQLVLNTADSLCAMLADLQANTVVYIHGRWASDSNARLPRLIQQPTKSHNCSSMEAAIDHLQESGVAHFVGDSDITWPCLLCDQRISSGTWLVGEEAGWAGSYLHYLRYHNIEPSSRAIADVCKALEKA